MIEPILKALVQLFALISDVHDLSEISTREKDIVRLFLSRQLNAELVDKYMEMFDEYLKQYNLGQIDRGSIREKKRTSLTAAKILGICEKINEELHQKQKLYVIVQLMDYIRFGARITENELEFIETVSSAFNMPEDEFLNIRSFILNSVDDIPEKKGVMIIDNKQSCPHSGVNHLFRENLKNEIFLLRISSTNSYILKYSGPDDLILNGQNIFPDQTYMFDHGSAIRGSGWNTIYYNDVSSVFTHKNLKIRISLDAVDVCLKFKNSGYGIQMFNYHEESGNLVGIMGGSGVGKTTLLNILSGITKPQSGEVLINGLNLYSEKDKAMLKGVIGFVPQDDLLLEELTVWQNLYYNAKMCLDNLTEDQLTMVVNQALAELDLEAVRDLKVGNSLNKVISGGQRKRLNIALELIREPTILFVDEPTSGLSSVDSEIVMNLLKEQSDRGRLVIINIHQPGSDIYKMFDKIMIIDKGGYQIFYGNPSQAIVYFKSNAGYTKAHEDQCAECGTINSEQLLQIIEAKVVDENGKQTHLRKISPQEWAQRFIGNAVKGVRKDPHRVTKLPENHYSIPGILKQTRIFFTRDILSKLENRQYVVISLFGAPLLAFLLAYFTKYEEGGSYIFSRNENIPAFLFMSVITSLFLGLIISAEEIVKDRKILKREAFLNLSWFSYLNSKIMIMFMISAIQTIAFILIGNYILEIKGMTFSYWIILFSTSCLANVLGLNISSAFNSVITIYILIPFIIIPQLLFSGVIVKFDRLHQNNATVSEYVPVIGDLMPARWSFEALAVEQFSKNRYEHDLFRFKMTQSQNNWYASFLINALKKDVWNLEHINEEINSQNNSMMIMKRLSFHINQLTGYSGFKSVPESISSSLQAGKYDESVLKITRSYLDSLAGRFRTISRNARNAEDSASKAIISLIGSDKYINLKNDYYNRSLEDMVLDRLRINQYIETDRKIIQKYEPAYMRPTSHSGRAHFYAPYKQIGNTKLDTYWFDFMVLWIVTLILYTTLYFNLMEKTVTYLGNLRIKEGDM